MPQDSCCHDHGRQRHPRRLRMAPRWTTTPRCSYIRDRGAHPAEHRPGITSPRKLSKWHRRDSRSATYRHSPAAIWSGLHWTVARPALPTSGSSARRRRDLALTRLLRGPRTRSQNLCHRGLRSGDTQEPLPRPGVRKAQLRRESSRSGGTLRRRCLLPYFSGPGACLTARRIAWASSGDVAVSDRMDTAQQFHGGESDVEIEGLRYRLPAATRRRQPWLNGRGRSRDPRHRR